MEELVAPNANKEWRWGDAGNSTVTLPEEEAGRLRGGKRRSGRMSGIRDMLRALKKGTAVGPSTPPVVDAAEEHHHHHHLGHQQLPVPLWHCHRQRFSSLRLRSVLSPPPVAAAGILICCLS
jgi:hypothetical protein